MSHIDQATAAAIVDRLERATRRLGVANAASFALEQLLQLPPAHRVVGAQWDHERQLVSLVIEGPGMPEVAHGDRIPEVRVRMLQEVSAAPAIRLVWPDCRAPQ